MPNTYPQETKEFVPVVVTVNGVVVTTGVKFQLAVTGTRPVGAWIDPVTLGGEIGVLIDQLAAGRWTIWAQVTSSPEVVVLDCGFFLVR